MEWGWNWNGVKSGSKVKVTVEGKASREVKIKRENMTRWEGQTKEDRAKKAVSTTTGAVDRCQQ